MVKITDGKDEHEFSSEEALAFLTNMLVELAFYQNMPVNILITGIQLKYELMERAYRLAGPNDEVH
jgi:hypothetical protein